MVHISFIPLLMWWSVKKRSLPQQLSCRPCSEEPNFEDFYDDDNITDFNVTLKLENIKDKIRKRSFLLGGPSNRRKFRKMKSKKRDVLADLEKIFLMDWINSYNDTKK